MNKELNDNMTTDLLPDEEYIYSVEGAINGKIFQHKHNDLQAAKADFDKTVEKIKEIDKSYVELWNTQKDKLLAMFDPETRMIHDAEEMTFQVMIMHQDYSESLHFIRAKSEKQLDYKIAQIDPYYIDYNVVSVEKGLVHDSEQTLRLGLKAEQDTIAQYKEYMRLAGEDTDEAKLWAHLIKDEEEHVRELEAALKGDYTLIKDEAPKISIYKWLAFPKDEEDAEKFERAKELDLRIRKYNENASFVYGTREEMAKVLGLTEEQVDDVANGRWTTVVKMKDSINKFEQSVGGIAKLLTNADLQENVSFAEGDQTFRTVLVETPRDKFDKVLEALKQEYEIDSHNGKNRIFVKIKDHFMGVLPKPKRYKYKGHIIVDVGYSSAPFSIEDYPYAKEFRSLEEAKEFIKKNLCDSEKVNYQPEKRYAVIYVFVNDILKEMHSHVQHTHANYKYFDKPEDAIAAYKRMKGSDLYARLELVYLESGKFWDGENEASYAEWINPVMVEKDVWNKAIDWEEFDKYLELQKSTKDSVSVIPSRKEEIIEEFTDDINDCLVDGGLDYKSFRITNEDKDFYVDFDSNEADAKKAYELLRDGFFKCNLVDDEGFYYVHVIRR